MLRARALEPVKGVLTRGQTDVQRLARELVTDPIYLASWRAAAERRSGPPREARHVRESFVMLLNQQVGDPQPHARADGHWLRRVTGC
jgi:hypothetical protein